MSSTTGRHSNGRGPAWQRRRRKQWLIDTFGDGTRVPCYHPDCPDEPTLGFETVTVDRIVPQVEGGTYRQDNIRPSCLYHNTSEGARLGWRMRHGSPDDYIAPDGDLAEPGCLNDERVSA